MFEGQPHIGPESGERETTLDERMDMIANQAEALPTLAALIPWFTEKVPSDEIFPSSSDAFTMYDKVDVFNRLQRAVDAINHDVQKGHRHSERSLAILASEIPGAALLRETFMRLAQSELQQKELWDEQKEARAA